ncbi:hypothetical protein PilKf_02488 [Pillotina sp. SPG140]|jgi:hypothetical protein
MQQALIKEGFENNGQYGYQLKVMRFVDKDNNPFRIEKGKTYRITLTVTSKYIKPDSRLSSLIMQKIIITIAGLLWSL